MKPRPSQESSTESDETDDAREVVEYIEVGTLANFEQSCEWLNTQVAVEV
jgi:hypothetical protein